MPAVLKWNESRFDFFYQHEQLRLYHNMSRTSYASSSEWDAASRKSPYLQHPTVSVTEILNLLSTMFQIENNFAMLLICQGVFFVVSRKHLETDTI